MYSGNYSKALALIDKALAICPDFPSHMDTKALILNQLGRYYESLEWYDKDLQRDPSFSISLNNKGVVLSNLGRYQEALVGMIML